MIIIEIMFLKDYYKIKMSSRPVLKGYFHLVATIIYLTIFPYLKSLTPPDLKLPFTIYILSIIGNFACSSLLHLINWSKDLEIYIRRLDQDSFFGAMQFVLDSMTSTFLFMREEEI